MNLSFNIFKRIVETIHYRILVQKMNSGGIVSVKSYNDQLGFLVVLLVWVIAIPTMLVAELTENKAIGGVGVIIIAIPAIIALQTLLFVVFVEGLFWEKIRTITKALISIFSNPNVRRQLFKKAINFATAKDERKKINAKLPKGLIRTYLIRKQKKS